MAVGNHGHVSSRYTWSRLDFNLLVHDMALCVTDDREALLLAARDWHVQNVLRFTAQSTSVSSHAV